MMPREPAIAAYGDVGAAAAFGFGAERFADEFDGFSRQRFADDPADVIGFENFGCDVAHDYSRIGM